jgi:serine/threonine-protein kinase
MGLTPLTMLGRYELLEELGEGGMGSVWLARLTGSGGFEKLCIVKTVLPAIARDADFLSRFQHEGRVLTQLQHSNIAQVFDMGDQGGTLFLALEYVPGVDVSRLVDTLRARQETMPVAMAVHLVQQAAEGLGFAHRRAALDGSPLGIVHRDVSPQNVMVSYDGEVKVIDFGIARSEARSRHTAQQSVLGKLGYMAPEQARGDAVDHRADQYALGVLLWELLTNAPYVRRGTMTEMVVAMANPTLRPLAALRPEVPPSLEAVLLKSLALDANDRFGTTDEFAQALQEQLLKLGSLPSKPQVGQFVRERCNDAFASQQTLLTRVASLRAGATAPTEPVDQTFVKESVAAGAQPPSAPATAPARPAARQAATPATEQLAVQRSPLPMALAAVAGLAVVGAVGWYAFAERAPAPTSAPVDARPVDAPPPAPKPVVVPDAVVAALTPPAPDAGRVEVAQPPTDVALGARGRITGPPSPEFIVVNTSHVDWTRCVVTLPRKLRARLDKLGRGATTELKLSTFHVDPSAEALTGEAVLECTEGIAHVRLQ